MAKNFSHGEVKQRESTRLTAVDSPQLQLPIPGTARRPIRPVFTLDQVRAIRTPQGAIEMAMRCSGLLSKEFQLAMQYDKGHWSRIENGDAPFPFPDLHQFMDIAGNEIPLIWMAEKRGHDWATIRPHYSETEAKLAKAEQENAELRRALELVVGARAR